MESLLTPADVAQRLNIHVDTVYTLIHQEELPAIRVGGQWRLAESEVRQWVEERHRPRPSKKDSL